MRNDQLKQTLLRAGFQVTEETRGQYVHEFDAVDDKPTWHTISQAERDFYTDTLKSNVSYQN
jgi:hypothetical protein